MNTQQYAEMVIDQVGDRYVFGAEAPLTALDPDTFDCSELVQWSYARAGVSIPDGSASQYGVTRAVDGALEVGDLFFLSGTYRAGISHVGIYVGDGRVVEARNAAMGVVLTTVQEVEKRKTWEGWRRDPKFTAAVQGQTYALTYWYGTIGCKNPGNVETVSALLKALNVWHRLVSDSNTLVCHESSAKEAIVTRWLRGRNLRMTVLLTEKDSYKSYRKTT